MTTHLSKTQNEETRHSHIILFTYMNKIIIV